MVRAHCLSTFSATLRKRGAAWKPPAGCGGGLVCRLAWVLKTAGEGWAAFFIFLAMGGLPRWLGWRVEWGDRQTVRVNGLGGATSCSRDWLVRDAQQTVHVTELEWGGQQTVHVTSSCGTTLFTRCVRFVEGAPARARVARARVA